LQQVLRVGAGHVGSGVGAGRVDSGLWAGHVGYVYLIPRTAVYQVVYIDDLMSLHDTVPIQLSCQSEKVVAVDVDVEVDTGRH
jgi:hypothetical protein